MAIKKNNPDNGGNRNLRKSEFKGDKKLASKPTTPKPRFLKPKYDKDASAYASGDEMKPFKRFDDESDLVAPKKSFKGSKSENSDKKPFVKKPFAGSGAPGTRRPYAGERRAEGDGAKRPGAKGFDRKTKPEWNPAGEFRRPPAKPKSPPVQKEAGWIRLNRYMASSGVASRREADTLIEQGLVEVNGKVMTEMGYQVKPGDVVRYDGRRLSKEKPVYVLVNKSKNYITTTEDPQGRKTVMDLVAGATGERLFPVGRLDRNTTGLLLMTNDGELAEKLMHPSKKIKKIYQAELDKKLTVEDFHKIAAGLMLEDGPIKPDDLAIITPDRRVVGIEIHEGRNRLVRRIFEHLGYEVVKLDRTVYAGLTKKDLPRGHWRHLTEKEVISIKHLF